MASKGQTFNKYSKEFKNEILKLLNQGVSSNYLSKKYRAGITKYLRSFNTSVW